MHDEAHTDFGPLLFQRGEFYIDFIEIILKFASLIPASIAFSFTAGHGDSKMRTSLITLPKLSI